MFFSIIIPAYNAVGNIEVAIESVINQICKDWELIIVDDGSTDDTRKVCLEYVKLDSRIKYIFMDNNGVSQARNKGILTASGEYIIFLDADDKLTNNALQVYIDILREELYDVIISNYYILSKKCEMARQINEKDVKLPEDLPEIIKISLTQSQYHGDTWYGNLHTVWGKCFKKSVIKKWNIKFQKELSIGEDMAFLISFVLYATSLKLTNQVTYYYIINSNSVMHSGRWTGNEPGKKFFFYIEKLTQDFSSENMLMDLWLETAENDWNTIHRSKMCFINKYIIFKNLMSDDLYRRFSINKTIQYSSKKEKLYCFLIRYKMTFLLVILSYCRMLKHK